MPFARSYDGTVTSPRATGFGARADDYDRLRPGPHPDALDWLLPPDPAARSPRPTVLDLAAGTGLVTRALGARAGRVVAVEPDGRMLARLVALTPSGDRVAPVRGRAEELPVADAAVDAVLVASAWHWFDPVRASAEIGRVLRPGGTLGLLWSRADPSVDWVAGVRAIGRAATDGSADLAGRGFVVELPPDAPFVAGGPRAFTRSRTMRRDDVAAMVATYSGVLALPGAEQRAVRVRARAFLDEALPDGGEDVEVPLETVCWRAVRTGAARAGSVTRG